jgi:hypothetical protein
VPLPKAAGTSARSSPATRWTPARPGTRVRNRSGRATPQARAIPTALSTATRWISARPHRTRRGRSIGTTRATPTRPSMATRWTSPRPRRTRPGRSIGARHAASTGLSTGVCSPAGGRTCPSAAGPDGRRPGRTHAPRWIRRCRAEARDSGRRPHCRYRGGTSAEARTRAGGRAGARHRADARDHCSAGAPTSSLGGNVSARCRPGTVWRRDYP